MVQFYTFIVLHVLYILANIAIPDAVTLLCFGYFSPAASHISSAFSGENIYANYYGLTKRFVSIMVDYRKFDNIDVSDDEEENYPTPMPRSGGSISFLRLNKNCKSCGKLNAKKSVQSVY